MQLRGALGIIDTAKNRSMFTSIHKSKVL